MKHLRCKIKGHNLSLVSKQQIPIHEYECTHCHQKFTKDGYGRIVKFTSYWEKNHEFFQNHFQKQILS